MKLSSGDVKAIAYEARLSMTDGELESAARYVNDFLQTADILKELDLKNTVPFRFAEAGECPLREDSPSRFGRITEILGARGDAEFTSLFKVPRIMEE